VSVPSASKEAWAKVAASMRPVFERHAKLQTSNGHKQLGTLGTGNHFIEVCLDEAQNVWVMLHSGSRGFGNRIGSYFIELAKSEMRRTFVNLPDKDLAYLAEGSKHFDDYMLAVGCAQEYALDNRKLMMHATTRA
jgi:tRNA-splicing ligase RtcB